MMVVFYLTIFLLVYLIYYYFVLKRKDKLVKFKDSMEMKYLRSRYQISFDKINVEKTMHLIAINNALIITIALIVIDMFDSYLVKIAIAFLVVVALQLLGFHILGWWLKRGEKNV